MNHKIVNEVIELSWNFASKWNITQSALVIIDSEGVIHNWNYSRTIPIVTYSVDHVYAITSPTLCDDINTIDFHPTVMLILLRKSKNDLYKILENHYRWVNYKVGTLLILYSFDINYEDNEKLLKRIFDISWSRSVASVMIMYWSTKCDCLHWFTYNGYKNEMYNKTSQHDFTNNLVNVSSNMYNYKIRSCFWTNLPESALFNYENGTIKPASLEGKAFYLMTQLLNCSNDIVSPLLNYSSFEASIYYDENNLCDVFFSTISRPSYLFNMANTYPIFTDYWCVMMPKGQLINGLQNFIMPFQSIVWHCLIFSIGISFAYWQLITVLNLPWHTSADKRFVIINVFGVFLNMGVNIKPHFLTYGSRIFMFFTAIFGFFVSYSYQSLLFGFLMVPRYYENLHALRDIGQSGIKIAMVHSTLKFWREHGNHEDYPDQFNKALFGVDSTSHAKMIDANNANFGYVLKQTRIKYVIRKSQDHPVFYQARECLKPIPRGYSVSCKFPLSKRIEELSQRLAEMGFFEHWKSYIGLEKLSINDSIVRDEYDFKSNEISFSMKNISSLLKVWATAIGLCIAVFIAEVLWRRNQVGK